MIKRLAIIPARSGSKRIKNKNITNFFGKPLILHSLEVIKKSNFFQKIHISTDSKKIANLGLRLNIKTDFLRPKKYSGDNVSIMETLRFVVNEFMKKRLYFDEIWLFYATNPFIKKKYIFEAEKIFKKNKKKNPLISVTKYNYPIEWALKLRKNKLIKIFKNKSHLDSRNTVNAYCDAGMFSIFNSKDLNKEMLFIPYIIPMYNSVDIDIEDDFKLAKKLFKN